MEAKTPLICMRLADMDRVHPKQDNSKKCSKCGEVVGIYPSGQALLAEHGDKLEIICHVCREPSYIYAHAPGYEKEPFESHPNPNKKWWKQ